MRWIIISILMMLTSLCNAQTYPKMTSDSLCVLTLPQVKLINTKLVELDEARDKLSEITRQNDTYNLAIKSLNRQLELESQSKANLLNSIETLNRINSIEEDRYKSMKKKYMTIAGVSLSVGLLGLLIAL